MSYNPGSVYRFMISILHNLFARTILGTRCYADSISWMNTVIVELVCRYLYNQFDVQSLKRVGKSGKFFFLSFQYLAAKRSSSRPKI